jgi:hypothetical protein
MDPSDKIQAFLDAFTTLQSSLDTCVNIQTALISIKVNQDVEQLGLFCCLEAVVLLILISQPET